MHAALGCGCPVRLPVRGIDDHIRPCCEDQGRDVVAVADIQIPPVNVGDGGNATVEGRRDAMTGARLTGDFQSEKAAATHHEKIHSVTV